MYKNEENEVNYIDIQIDSRSLLLAGFKLRKSTHMEVNGLNLYNGSP